MKWTGRREIARSDWDEEKLKIIIWTVRELVVIEPLASKLSSSYKTFPACNFLIWLPRSIYYMVVQRDGQLDTQKADIKTWHKLQQKKCTMPL